MMSSEEIEKTINNFDLNFSRLMIELLDKLSVMATSEKEQEMMNLMFRLDHNSYYSEFQRKKIAVKGNEPNLTFTKCVTKGTYSDTKFCFLHSVSVSLRERTLTRNFVSYIDLCIA